jgi:hypothetical protein
MTHAACHLVHDEPDVLGPLFMDKDMVRMFIEISRLPASQRKTVTSCMVLLVRAFGGRVRGR